MNQFKSLGSAVAVVGLAALLVGQLYAHTKKGDKFFKQAEQAETAKKWDDAMNLYDQALATDPKDATYLLYDQRIHAKASQAELAEARDLQKEQKLDLALKMFQKAYLADPSSQAALQEIRSTTTMLRERARNPAGTPIYTPAERARMEVERRVNSLEGPPTLRPINAEITSLKVNNQPARVLYESVCKLAGINMIEDPAGLEPPGTTNKNFNLDLNNATLEEALGYIALKTHTFWKPISHNAIFVSQEGEQKRQEYQDEVVKVFYIQNASTPNEFSEIFNGVRVGAKMASNMFQVASQNAIIARGSPDTIALVEKLVHDLDRPKAEVNLDIIIMQVNKTKAQTIGAALLGQGGLSVPLNFTPRNQTPVTTSGTTTSGTATTGLTTGTTGTTTGTTASQFTIAQAGHLSSADFSTTLPSTVVQALLNDNTTRILQRPELRATDGGKASLKIGQKIPYVSGSLNSAVATPGSIPYATTQFQQIDVGTLIDLEPHVNGTEDVSMKIHVELSNQLAPVSIGGINEPVIGQQIDEATIRMRDGEVSILGGLSDQEKTNAFSGLPGFTNIPLLSYLFGSKTLNTTDNQLLIAIIPHIIRSPDYSDVASQGVFAGTERVPRVERAPSSSVQVQLPTPEGAAILRPATATSPAVLLPPSSVPAANRTPAGNALPVQVIPQQVIPQNVPVVTPPSQPTQPVTTPGPPH